MKPSRNKLGLGGVWRWLAITFILCTIIFPVRPEANITSFSDYFVTKFSSMSMPTKNIIIINPTPYTHTLIREGRRRNIVDRNIYRKATETCVRSNEPINQFLSIGEVNNLFILIKGSTIDIANHILVGVKPLFFKVTMILHFGFLSGQPNGGSSVEISSTKIKARWVFLKAQYCQTAAAAKMPVKITSSKLVKLNVPFFCQKILVVGAFPGGVVVVFWVLMITPVWLFLLFGLILFVSCLSPWCSLIIEGFGSCACVFIKHMNNNMEKVIPREYRIFNIAL